MYRNLTVAEAMQFETGCRSPSSCHRGFRHRIVSPLHWSLANVRKLEQIQVPFLAQRGPRWDDTWRIDSRSSEGTADSQHTGAPGIPAASEGAPQLLNTLRKCCRPEVLC